MKKRDGNVLPVAESFVFITKYVIPATSKLVIRMRAHVISWVSVA